MNVSRHERMDWEAIAFMLGDIETLYRESGCYSDRHTYTPNQRRIMLALGFCLEAWKGETEEAIAHLLIGVEKNE